jgi:hypothetical protein
MVIAALLEGESAVDWYVRKDTPVPNEETWKQMIIKVQIIVSILKTQRAILETLNMCASDTTLAWYTFSRQASEKHCAS